MGKRSPGALMTRFHAPLLLAASAVCAEEYTLPHGGRFLSTLTDLCGDIRTLETLNEGSSHALFALDYLCGETTTLVTQLTQHAVYHPPWADLKARLRRNEEGADTTSHYTDFGQTALEETFLTSPFSALPLLFLMWRCRALKFGPGRSRDIDILCRIRYAVGGGLRAPFLLSLLCFCIYRLSPGCHSRTPLALAPPALPRRTAS